MPPPATEPDPHFTLFIRLPFPRGDFVDPPPVNWDASKDHALWGILSRPSKGNDIDWKALADDLDVTLPFLLQQAAWLYDRQLSQVRARMRKVGNQHSASPSPTPGAVLGSGAIGSHAMKRVGSGGSMVPPRLSIRQREGPGSRYDGSAPSTPVKSKAPANRVVPDTGTPSQVPPARSQSPRSLPAPQPRATLREPAGRAPPTNKREQQPSAPTPVADHESTESSSQSSDSEDEETTRRRLPFKRLGKFSIHRPSRKAERDEDDDSPAFLPLANPGEPTGQYVSRDPSATLRQEFHRPGLERPATQILRTVEEAPPSIRTPAVESPSSSASSGVAVNLPANDGLRSARQADAVSPRRPGELARLSPRGRGAGREGSEGTPSMGSSFSDLDDASLTQSALEEALLSKMQHGGVASRMSTISQALKSRYL